MSLPLRPYVEALGQALGLLTRLPLPAASWRADRAGLALRCFPAAGLLLGLALAALHLAALWLWQAPLLVAAITVAGWALLTGALHLDGLADTTDAWLGAHKAPERALRILQDPASGPGAVVALLLVLGLKIAALHALAPAGGASLAGALVLAVVLARTGAMGLFATLPYLRPAGLGSAMAAQASPAAIGRVAGVSVLLVIALAGGSGGWAVLAALASTALFALGARRWLGGFTGDLVGAQIELTELAVLLMLALTQAH
ncbi:MAG: adenosylcobinamide-GDP ribazoletransferase [Pseudomonadota bacterium]|nr:adenosylcobinamide-GDP ribazoletransferase [Pseudomonadota bacterium]